MNSLTKNRNQRAPRSESGVETPARRRRRTPKLIAGIAGALLVGTPAILVGAATPPPAHINNTVGLKAVGPIDETNGFPLWYRDTTGQRLELCLDQSPNCIMGDLPNPGQPMVFPTNFPDEAFWSMGEAALATNGAGGKALLVTALEAAFANDVADGQQISFGRVRIRAAGVIDGATYRVTHPYGVDTIVAETGAAKGINVTEDIGDLIGGSTFEGALGSRPAPFLKWDATAPAAPAGYLGDPTVEHTVVGSPYNTNVFRIEGPLGSFPGSPNQCTNPTLGDSTSASDLSDCIETNLFTVMGKLATRAGVQVSKAVYADESNGHTIDLFAKSEPGQRLVISGTGIAQTEMRSDGSGNYYGRIFAEGTPPADLAVTNITDNPKSVDHVDPSLFGDKVHILGAIYDNDTQRLTVETQSGDNSALLALQGYPGVVAVSSGSSKTFTVNNVSVPPADVVVTSSKGGTDDDDVVITGTDFTAVQVVASIAADVTSVAVGQAVTLDGTNSTGTISNFAWTQTGGSAVSFTANAPSITFTPTIAGSYSFKLTVTGAGAGNTSSDNISFNVIGSATPVANAGPDQLNMAPTSTVTLNGTASQFAATFAWTAPAGITLAKADTANPTFVVPASTAPLSLTFTLKVTGATGATSTDTVVVTTDPDTLSVDSATFKRGGNEWRVRGTAQYCSVNNLITFTWNKPGAAPVVLGSQTPSLAVGVCSFDFRLKDAATSARPTAAGTITITSVMGGQVVNQTFQLL
jgi:PKD repeat protein